MDKSRVLEALRAGSIDPFYTARYHKDSPSPPAAPDYAGAAQAQGAANVETARAQGRMNNPNIITPYGSQTVTWGGGGRTFNQTGYDDAMRQYNQSLQGYQPGSWIDQGGDDGQTWQANAMPVAPDANTFWSEGNADQPTVTQTLSPSQQQLFDAQNRISQNLAGVAETGLNRVAGGFEQPFDTSTLPQRQTSVTGDYGADRQAVTDALLARIEPQFQRDEELMRTRLTNQGIPVGSEASNFDLDTLNRARNDARMQAVLSGGQEQSRLFNMGLANANLGNQGRQQAIQEQAYLRSLPLNEINALRTGAQVQNPQFQPYQGVSLGQTPVMQGAMAQGQANQQMYNNQVGQSNAFNQGLFSLGSAALGPFGFLGRG